MTVKATSRSSYYQHVITGKAETQRERILACLLDSAVPLNRRQISELTGIPINAVTGRVNALMEKDRDGYAFVVKAYDGRDPVTRRPCEYLEAATVVYRTGPDGQMQFVMGAGA